MGRISYEDAEKYQAGGGEWLKLSNDGDVATVQFLNQGMDDLDVFSVHKVTVNGKDRKCSCLREYNDPIDVCPLCAAGMKPMPTILLSMVDVKDNSVKIWERGKTFISKMQSLVNRYAPLSQVVFDIERHGRPGEASTTYDIIKVADEIIDVSQFEKPEFLGSVILDKTAEEMEVYLQTGNFPQDNTRPQQQTSQRGGRRNVQEQPQQTQQHTRGSRRR